MKIAVIDLGSNSFHMVVYRTKGNQLLDVCGREVEVNALGRYISSSGVLPREIIIESADIVQRLVSRARILGAKEVYAYGTRIFRSLKNSRSLIDEIFRRSGIVVDLISAQEEASIVHQAAKYTYDLGERSLILDIGGGSSECVLSVKGQMRWFTSIHCGTAALLTEFERKKVYTKNEQDIIIRKIYRPAIHYLKDKRIELSFGTSGFLRYVARWFNKTKDFQEPVVLRRADIQKSRSVVLRDDFTKGTQRERSLVAVGLAILSVVMCYLNIDAITVSEASSREGYVLKKLEK